MHTLFIAFIDKEFPTASHELLSYDPKRKTFNDSRIQAMFVGFCAGYIAAKTPVLK